MRLVILESPYAGDVTKNTEYARACLRDCLLRGEAPLASHLLYTQPGVLDDTVRSERALGIEAGLCWGRFAQATVVYVDRGTSAGMLEGIERAKREGRPVELRRIYNPIAESVAIAPVATSNRHSCDRCGKLVWATWFVPVPGAKSLCGACCDPPREEAEDPALGGTSPNEPSV